MELDVTEITFLEFLYKTGQWLRDEQSDISKERAIKLLSMVEVLILAVDPTRKVEIIKRLNQIAE